MKIKWMGHACFLIIGRDGTRIITDPYGNNERVLYDPVREEADIVLVSHEHFDHVGGTANLSGNPQIFKEAGRYQAKGVDIEGIATFHDPEQGSQRGKNTIFVFTVDGMKLCHMGDLGHPLTPEQQQKLGNLDILFLPVGGFFTIEPALANKTCRELAPRVVIPMHYRTEKCALPIAGVEDFLAQQQQVRRLESSEVEFERGKLPSPTETVVLAYAM